MEVSLSLSYLSFLSLPHTSAFPVFLFHFIFSFLYQQYYLTTFFYSFALTLPFVYKGICISHIVVGTPDMIEKELLKRKYIDASMLRVLVFDEAYELMQLTGLTPTKKQVLRIQEAVPSTCDVTVVSF